MEIVNMQTRSSAKKTKPEMIHDIEISAPADSNVIINTNGSQKSNEQNSKTETHENSESRNYKVKNNGCNIVKSVYLEAEEQCNSKIIINTNQKDKHQLNDNNSGKRDLNDTSSDLPFKLKLKINSASSESKSLVSVTVNSENKSQNIDNENLVLNGAKYINKPKNQNARDYTSNIQQNYTLKNLNANKTECILRANQGTSLQNMSIPNRLSNNTYDNLQYSSQSENSAYKVQDEFEYQLGNSSVEENEIFEVSNHHYRNLEADISDESLDSECVNESVSDVEHEEEVCDADRAKEDNSCSVYDEDISSSEYEENEGNDNNEDNEDNEEEEDDEDDEDDENDENDEDIADPEIEEIILSDSSDVDFTQHEGDNSFGQNQTTEGIDKSRGLKESALSKSFMRQRENEASNDGNAEGDENYCTNSGESSQGNLEQANSQFQNSDSHESSAQPRSVESGVAKYDTSEIIEDLNNSIQEIAINDKENVRNTHQKDSSIASARQKNKDGNGRLLKRKSKRKQPKPSKAKPFQEIQINRWISNIEEINNFKSKFEAMEGVSIFGLDEKDRTNSMEKYNLSSSRENLARNLGNAVDESFEKGDEFGFRDSSKSLNPNPRRLSSNDLPSEGASNRNGESSDSRTRARGTRKRKGSEMELDKREDGDSDCEIIYTSEKLSRLSDNKKVRKSPQRERDGGCPERGTKIYSRSIFRSSFRKYVTRVSKKFRKGANLRKPVNPAEKSVAHFVEREMSRRRRRKCSNPNLSSAESPNLAFSLSETNNQQKKSQKRKYSSTTADVKQDAAMRPGSSAENTGMQPEQNAMEKNLPDLPDAVLEELAPERTKAAKSFRSSKAEEVAEPSGQAAGSSRPPKEGCVPLSVPGPTAFSVVLVEKLSKGGNDSPPADPKTEATKKSGVKRVRYSLLEEYKKRKEKRNLRL